jgi:oxygen-independent coproporphyrinogen III oxidase
MAGIYLHIPFCTKRCIYCDFYFVTTDRNHAPFVRAMQAEIESYGRALSASEPIESIYFGGGTPSMLALEDVARLLESVLGAFDCSAVKEVTFEANPENASRAYLEGLKAMGFTRLSLGVQSFYGEDLQFMGRAHDERQAAASVETALATGFEALSIDLIFGVPDQPEERWMANLERAVALGVPHVSTYGLTVEERTPLAKMVSLGRILPAEEETLRERYLNTIDYLSSSGYEHYEISSFSRPGGRSLHNQLYWRHGNYVGVGPSAHSLWWQSASRAARWANVRNLRQYVALLDQKQRPIEAQDVLGMDELADEYVMLRLRLPLEGLDLDTLEQRYGVDLLSEKLDEIAALEEAGLARLRGGVLRLTPAGAVVADAVTARLLPDGSLG